MRDYRHIDRYLNELLPDIYPQPPDEGHIAMAQEVINRWLPYYGDARHVLDVGCGQGFTEAMFRLHGLHWTGVTLGEDYQVCKAAGLNVLEEDFSFLPLGAGLYDLIFSRHSLEHSPFPLLTLMEWWRVGKRWLMLVLPTAESFGWAGRNHYSVMSDPQVKFLLDRAGWRVEREDFSETRELRYFCEHYDRE